MILHGKHLIKAWTKQQSIVATNTAEAELYAGNGAATESMGVQLSVISRTGLGKAKPIEIQHLWLQEAVRSGKLSGEDAHRDELFGLGHEASHKREIGDVPIVMKFVHLLKEMLDVQDPCDEGNELEGRELMN